MRHSSHPGLPPPAQHTPLACSSASPPPLLGLECFRVRLVPCIEAAFCSQPSCCSSAGVSPAVQAWLDAWPAASSGSNCAPSAMQLYHSVASRSASASEGSGSGWQGGDRSHHDWQQPGFRAFHVLNAPHGGSQRDDREGESSGTRQLRRRTGDRWVRDSFCQLSAVRSQDGLLRSATDGAVTGSAENIQQHNYMSSTHCQRHPALAGAPAAREPVEHAACVSAGFCRRCTWLRNAGGDHNTQRKPAGGGGGPQRQPAVSGGLRHRHQQPEEAAPEVCAGQGALRQRLLGAARQAAWRSGAFRLLQLLQLSIFHIKPEFRFGGTVANLISELIVDQQNRAFDQRKTFVPCIADTLRMPVC